MGIFSRKKKIEDKKEEAEILKPKPVKGKTETLDIKKKPAGPRKPEVKKFKDVYGILVRPLLTEKISGLGMHNQYAFEVNPKANKVEIKKAMETYYNVKPIGVNIVNIQGKSVRWGRTRGKTRSWKKAIVTLRQGDKIELYEGV